MWFSIETPDAPFVVKRETGEVTSAGVFRGLSGTTIQVQVRAFDNFGMPPSQSVLDTLLVSTAQHTRARARARTHAHAHTH